MNCVLASYTLQMDFFILCISTLVYIGIIEKYHKGFCMNTMKHVSDMDVKKICSKLESHTQKRIISTRIRCARNLNWFPLNTCGTKETRLQITALMEKVNI